MADPLTEVQVMNRLAIKYPAPEWAFMPQVGDGTGWHKVRTADAIAMNLWPSRGMELWGFEVKVQRADWLREMKTPAKSEGFIAFCDRWYLVAGHRGLVEEGELPPTWGLIEPHGAGLKVSTVAPLLHEKQVAFDRAFMAGVLRAATRTITWDAKLQAARKEGHEQGKKDAEGGFEYDQEQHTELKAKLKAFEEAAGIHIGQWDSMDKVVRMGEAVRLIIEGGVTSVTNALDDGITDLERSLKYMKKTRDELRGSGQNTLLPGSSV